MTTFELTECNCNYIRIWPNVPFPAGGDYLHHVVQPGASFPLRVHNGEHKLHVVSGNGYIFVSGRDVLITGGDAVYLPAELPHEVAVRSDEQNPLVFVKWLCEDDFTVQ